MTTTTTIMITMPPVMTSIHIRTITVPPVTRTVGGCGRGCGTGCRKRPADTAMTQRIRSMMWWKPMPPAGTHCSSASGVSH